MINATKLICRRNELDAAVLMPFVVGMLECEPPFTHDRE
jgi:hypothetical protein